MHSLNIGYAFGLVLILASGCIGFRLRASEDDVKKALDQSSAPQSVDEDWLVDIADVDDEKMKGVVTLEFDSSSDNQTPEDVKKFFHKLRLSIAHSLNNAAQSTNGKPAAGHVYSEDDVSVISVNPPVYEGLLRVPVYVRERGTGGVVSSERLKRAVDDPNINSPPVDPKLDDSYTGTPTGVTPGSGSPSKPTIWEDHKWFFIIIAIFFVISIILLAICLSCMLCECCKCRKQHQPIKPVEQQHLEPARLSPKGKQPLEIQEEPLLAAAAKPAMAQAPLQQEPPPPPYQNDDENGWIIPMDQLTQEELQQTEVPLTRF